jgi:glutamate transport system substrate-binding protein
MRLRAIVTVLATLLAGAAAGCGADGGGGGGSILDQPTLVVGVRPDLPLIGRQLPGGGFEGLDVDVARYVADHLGARIELVATRAADREPMLLAGEVDLVFAIFSITQDRKTRVGFAGPYFVSYQDLLVRDSETGIAGVRDLAGRNLCAVSGSNVPDRVVEERGVPATLVPADGYDECMAMLRDGTVDALATNDVILAGLAHGRPGVRLVGARYSQERTGVGMRPGDVAGCEAVNRAITDMYQDGTARRLLEKWFGGTGIDLSTVAVPQFEGCS